MKFENLLNESYNGKQYIYVSVIYEDDIVAKTIGEPSFYYKTDIKEISIGDKVLVDRCGKEVVGIIINKDIYGKDDAPFPINKTKPIIKILEKAKSEIKDSNDEFFIDPGDYYMLIIHNSTDIKDEVKFYRSYVAKKSDFNIEELIKKCSLIFVIGNIDISEYDLSNKYVFNINNENNYGRHTAISYLSNQRDIINLIKAINYGLLYTGFITVDLYDIESGINGKIQYKKYSVNDKDKIFKEFDVNSCKKMFIIFEAPNDCNLFELESIIQTFRDNYEKCDFNFAIPVISGNKELSINVFCKNYYIEDIKK